MIFDPNDTRVALDHHGRVLVSRITGRDERGHVIVEWVPTVTIDFHGKQSDDFTRPLW